MPVTNVQTAVVSHDMPSRFMIKVWFEEIHGPEFVYMLYKYFNIFLSASVVRTYNFVSIFLNNNNGDFLYVYYHGII